MADPADINVDELRRRARRRLVGAIVLALAAAVIVPMLLESDPKPLGDSVAVKIPPVDDGKFVNRLSDGAAPRPAEVAPPKGDATTARKSVSDAEKAVVNPPGKAPKYDTQIAAEKAPSPPPGIASAPATTAPADTNVSAPKAEAKSDTKVETKVETKAEPKSEAPPGPKPEVAKAETKSEAKAEPKAEAKAPAEAAAHIAPPAVKDGFSVQLAAFSDDKGANALANRLKRTGYPAYTEPLKTSRGTLWRVRVGPYPTRDTANGVRDKLKAEGQSGIVAPSR
ncbi:MAG TPA: SPOR domain-containing protein [Casimicrobiaceae bacterium]|nr:SPOR domain-containing protein [Casimicrobiaceae bacterium]